MIRSDLKEYDFPSDLKKMTDDELDLLSYQIRDFLLDKVSVSGGHLASNLGAVELTIALHRQFESPKDKIIWDVGHQSYVHKILTGRASGFDNLRKLDGLSGFPKKKESIHDHYDAGHGSSSLSFAAGLAAARDLNKDKYSVVAVIGDGALTGGLAYEALNNIGDSGARMIIVLNDNGMSIAPNIGGVSRHLRKLRASKRYLRFKKTVKKTVTGIPAVGQNIYSHLSRLRDSIRYSVIDEGVLFEEMGIKYLGPVDGHDIHALTHIFDSARQMNGPVIIHVITEKGKGYSHAEAHPEKFHGTGPFDIDTGKPVVSSDVPTYSQIFGQAMKELGSRDRRIVAVGAAMLDSTGLTDFRLAFPKRVFDVGIAEEHAVTFAAGLAQNGFIPVVSIYSTFLQRAYDEIMEDVCLQELPVIFALDRAGAVGADGETHHGIFDISYLNHMPGMTVMAPSSRGELTAMLEFAVKQKGPCAIRYPRGKASGDAGKPVIDGKSRIISTGKDVEIWAAGCMCETAEKTASILKDKGIDCGVVNAMFIKPLDDEGLRASSERTSLIVTMEDNVVTGGFGQAVSACLAEKDIKTPVRVMGWPDAFIEHGSVDQLRKRYGLDPDSAAERICDLIEKKA